MYINSSEHLFEEYEKLPELSRRYLIQLLHDYIEGRGQSLFSKETRAVETLHKIKGLFLLHNLEIGELT